MIERRALIWHQGGTGDPAEVERGLVDGEDTEIDETGRDQRTPGVQHVIAGRGGDIAPRHDPAFLDAQCAGARLAGGEDQPAAGYGERARGHAAAPSGVSSLGAQPGRPRARRVNTSRQAMRIATPLSTCRVMRLRVG